MTTRHEAQKHYVDTIRWRYKHKDFVPGLIVGQSAPKLLYGTVYEPMYPFPATGAGARLVRFSGLSVEEYFALFDRINTVDMSPVPQTGKKGDNFNPKEAAEIAVKKREFLRMEKRVCVFIGKANASLYYDTLPEPFEIEIKEEGGVWTWMPHTSGINQFWNSGENKTKCRHVFDVLYERLTKKEEA